MLALWGLAIVFLITRLINLTSIPVFADEAIPNSRGGDCFAKTARNDVAMPYFLAANVFFGILTDTLDAFMTARAPDCRTNKYDKKRN